MNRPGPITQDQLRAAHQRLALHSRGVVLGFEAAMASQTHRRVIEAMALQQAWRDFRRRATPQVATIRRCRVEPDGSVTWCTQRVPAGYDDQQASVDF